MLTCIGHQQGVPEAGDFSRCSVTIYLTEVDRVLERAKEATRNGKYTYVEYARFADDLVVLIDAHLAQCVADRGGEQATSGKNLPNYKSRSMKTKSRRAQSDRGRKLQLSGVRLPTPAQHRKAGVASALHAEDEEAQRRCCVSSRRCSGDTNPSRWTGWSN